MHKSVHHLFGLICLVVFTVTPLVLAQTSGTTPGTLASLGTASENAKTNDHHLVFFDSNSENLSRFSTHIEPLGRIAGTIRNKQFFANRGFGLIRRTGNSGPANMENFTNTFLGTGAGLVNTGYDNTFIGYIAGQFNTTALSNTFVGSAAGYESTTGSYNTYIGSGAGQFTRTGGDNTFVGARTGENTTEGYSNTMIGTKTGRNNTTGFNNTFLGTGSGGANSTGIGNTFLGKSAGNSNTSGVYNTLIGLNSDVASGYLVYATALGAGAIVSNSNSVVLGRSNGSDTVRIPGAVLIDGSLVVHTLGSAGSTQLCLNTADRLAPCSSSLRYKTNVQSFPGGLDIVKRLRPITFNWKDGGLPDIGFGAEEVEGIEPRLATYDKKGEIEGVKYAQLTTVLVNAVKEQQTQIEQYHVQLAAQERELAAIKKLLCLSHPKAAVCQSAVRLKR